jgi:MinD superfamily P-loop ATPase
MTTLEATYIVTLDDSLCSACRACLPVCSYGGLMPIPGEKIPRVDPWACSGCGTCLTVCPEDALRVIPRGSG